MKPFPIFIYPLIRDLIAYYPADSIRGSANRGVLTPAEVADLPVPADGFLVMEDVGI